ncbi:unnamed protein product [Strongylus vulgaris]|uniref:Uncharacterized protein n=1 Tax=Strongylus vulgaris TaxID=40348 RepID=A0A3P7JSI1_STRVU|nr:unnamed protein product [Strongylus vulgaris]
MQEYPLKKIVEPIVVNQTVSTSKEESKGGISLRSRSASPGLKLLNRTPKEKKDNLEKGEAKKNKEGKPPAPEKNSAKEAVPEPEKVPVLITKAMSVKMREAHLEKDVAKLKKKRATIASSSSQDTKQEFLPKEDFSFEALKDKLIRRVSKEHENPPPKKECISITSVSSVRDRLRQFEGKK